MYLSYWIACVVIVITLGEALIPEWNEHKEVAPIEIHAALKKADCSVSPSAFCRKACKQICANGKAWDVYADCIDKLPPNCQVRLQYWHIIKFPGLAHGTTTKTVRTSSAYKYIAVPFFPSNYEFGQDGDIVFGYSHQAWEDHNASYANVKNFEANSCNYASTVVTFQKGWNTSQWDYDLDYYTGFRQHSFDFGYLCKFGPHGPVDSSDPRLTRESQLEAAYRMPEYASLSAFFHNDVVLRRIQFGRKTNKDFDTLVFLEPKNQHETSCFKFRSAAQQTIYEDETARSLFMAIPKVMVVTSGGEKLKNAYGEFVPQRDSICSKLEGYNLCRATESCSWCMTPFGHVCSADCSHEMARKTTFENREGPLEMGAAPFSMFWRGSVIFLVLCLNR